MIEADGPPRIDELLDKAFEAFGAGDRATANVLAEQVLALDIKGPTIPRHRRGISSQLEHSSRVVLEPRAPLKRTLAVCLTQGLVAVDIGH